MVEKRAGRSGYRGLHNPDSIKGKAHEFYDSKIWSRQDFIISSTNKFGISINTASQWNHEFKGAALI